MVYMKDGGRFRLVPLDQQARMMRMTYSEMAAHDDRMWRFAMVLAGVAVLVLGTAVFVVIRCL